MSRLFAVFFSLLSYALFPACQGEASQVPSRPEKPVAMQAVNGKAVYLKNCKICHGSDGRLQLSGASNLATSTLPKEEVMQVITNGRKGMAAYRSLLSPEEIDAVSDYVLELRDKKNESP